MTDLRADKAALCEPSGTNTLLYIVMFTLYTYIFNILNKVTVIVMSSVGSYFAFLLSSQVLQFLYTTMFARRYRQISLWFFKALNRKPHKVSRKKVIFYWSGH